jgi:endogenous inhibitor of DNA gyrase (YacG/DUF329 family)
VTYTNLSFCPTCKADVTLEPVVTETYKAEMFTQACPTCTRRFTMDAKTFDFVRELPAPVPRSLQLAS